MHSRLTTSIVLLVIVLLAPLIVLAQGGATGAITGTVQDQSSALVPKAQVQISGIAGTVRDLVTDSNGVFTAPLLPSALIRSPLPRPVLPRHVSPR